jgi:hypothetical protein
LASQTFAQQTATTPNAAAVAAEYGKLPMRFEINEGQSDPQVKFSARGRGYSLFLTESAAVLALSREDAKSSNAGTKLPAIDGKPAAPMNLKSDVVRMELLGAATGLHVTGAEPLPGKVNYLRGDDPQQWRKDIPTYSKVKYSRVYPGVDLVYYGNQGQLEFDFVVAPGADAKPVRFHFSGARKLTLDHDGNLVVSAKSGEVVFHKPVVYQMKDGEREPVKGEFQLLAKNKLGFALGDYDRSRELVIDPVLAYSTYLGGTGGGSGGDIAYGIAVDAAGNAYIAGTTYSSDFPVKDAPFPVKHQGAFNCPGMGLGNSEAFITELNPEGTAEVYSTYLGGSGGDGATAIAVDSLGDAYVTGFTCSTNFPHYVIAYQTVNKGAANHTPVAFVAEIGIAGNDMVYGTYLGGSGNATGNGNGFTGDGDIGNGIAVDSATGDAYVIGTTYSTNFPVTSNAYQQNSNNAGFYGNSSVFVSKLDHFGTSLIYSTYVGPDSVELTAIEAGNVQGSAIAVDSSGMAYLTGNTYASAFPVTWNAYQSTPTGFPSTFVTTLRPDGADIVYSTFLTGDLGSVGKAIALDSSDNIYVAGNAFGDFPTTPGAAQTSYAGGFYGENPVPNAFITKLNPQVPGKAGMVYSTYLGGTGYYDADQDDPPPGDTANGIAVDATGVAHVTGMTHSSDFPIRGAAYQTMFPSASTRFSAFYTQVSADGTSFPYSTYLGGKEGDVGEAIAVDSSNDAYLAGYTFSGNFPVLHPFQATNKDQDSGTAFVTKFETLRRRIIVCLPCIFGLNPGILGDLGNLSPSPNQP